MAGRRPQSGFTGFTLADTAVSLALTAVLVLAMSAFLADNQRGFNKTYVGAFSDVTDAALMARAVFQKTIRQACSAVGAASVAQDGSWIQVQYYSSSDAPSPDRLARFELSGQDLLVQKSVSGPGEMLSLETVCRNVASVKFGLTGRSAQMSLTLEDGTSSQVLNTCATMRSP